MNDLNAEFRKASLTKQRKLLAANDIRISKRGAGYVWNDINSDAKGRGKTLRHAVANANRFLCSAPWLQ